MALGRVLLLASVLSTAALHAQTTFAPIGAKWTYTQGSCCGPYTNLMVIEAVSDTVVQGRTCSKLRVNEGWFGCHEFVQFFSGSNDSLFYYDADAEQFHLLFRWNAVVGETWSTPVTQSGYLDTLDWSVSDTGHVMIDGSWLRTLEVNVGSREWMIFSDGGTVTERLGVLGTPFTWILGFCDGETFRGLRCYEDPDITWQNPQFPQCALSVGIEGSTIQAPFSLQPTLATTGDPIQVTASVGSIIASDATGRIVLRQAIQGQGSFSLASPGSYVVRFISASGQVAHQRIVVR